MVNLYIMVHVKSARIAVDGSGTGSIMVKEQVFAELIFADTQEKAEQIFASKLGIKQIDLYMGGFLIKRVPDEMTNQIAVLLMSEAMTYLNEKAVADRKKQEVQKGE